MKAYTQGEIDYFCGVYAIINACRRMMSRRRPFSYNDGCLFYQHLMDKLIAEGRIAEVLHHGTNYDLLRSLLEEARVYVRETFGAELSFDQPYAGTDKTLEQTAEEIGEALNNPVHSYIIRFNNREVGDHWSVISQRSRNSFRLFDSYAYPAINLKTSSWIPEKISLNMTKKNPTGVPQPPKGRTYIVKHGLFFLSLS